MLSDQFEERFIDFGISVIELVQQHKTELPFSVADQVIRSATSIGANYAEAQNASSKADFKNKIFIAKKEAGETRYWLRLIARIVGDTDIAALSDEVQQIILILQKIVTTLREKSAQ